MSVSVGCDPEFVVLDPQGLPVPAHSVGIEQKANSKIGNDVYGIGYGIAFRDGYNVEINLNSAIFCRAQLLNRVGRTIAAVKAAIPKGYTVVARAAYPIRVEEQMKDAPHDVTEFGCSPSLDAYTGEQKVVVLKAREHPYRYAGGHFHFGNTNDYGGVYDYMYGSDPENVIADRSKNPLVVKLFDKYIGIPLAVVFNDDMQWERRKYYGQAGEYREQNYSEKDKGVEYRVPPPEVFNHTAMISLVSGLGRDIITNFKSYAATYDPKLDVAIVNAINTGKGAADLLVEAPKWYIPDTIIELAKRPEIREMQVDKAPEGHFGWNDFAKKWGLPGTHVSTT